jgi:hypothetical protein
MNDPHDPLEARLRQLAHELHDAAPVPLEWDDIAAIPMVTSGPGTSTPGRRRWPIAAVAASLVVFAIAGLVIIRSGTDEPQGPVTTDPATVVDGAVDPSIPDRAPPTVASPNATTGTAADTTTTAPQQSSTTATAPPTPTAANLTPISATYLDPPPMLELTTIAAVELAFDPARGGPSASAIALDNGAVAVIDHAAREIIVVDPTAGDRRVPLDAAMPNLTGLAVGGPDRVLYVIFEGGLKNPLSATEIAAIPTDGPRAGQAIATSPIDLISYTHTHPSVLGLGPTSVVDKRTGESLIHYVDATGGPLQAQLPAPAYPLAQPIENWAAFETGLEVAPTKGAPATWHVDVDRAPGSFGGLGDLPEPTAIDSGRVLVTTAIGPSRPGDYGAPTQHVVAVLDPDGSGSWRSIPEDWQLAAADLYGPLYTRIIDSTIEISRPQPIPT